jgi:predicted 3-demethylubiquinone-9 3-methyltransferase (glyoxalase superfamily)
MSIKRISPCLWFDTQAEEAAKFYVTVFRNSRIVGMSRFPEAGNEIHGKPAGSVMVVDFELDGQPLTALNGGPQFKLSEAISLQVLCDTQEEIDHYWNALSEGGDPRAQQCGWLKDRYGLSWQVIPSGMAELMRDHGSGQAKRAMTAMLQMKKIDIAVLERAAAG